MSKGPCAVALFVFILLASSAFAEPLTIDSFLSQVREGNPNAEAARSRAEAFEHRVKPTSTLDDPFVAAGVDQIPFGGGTGSMYRFQVSQAIPFPGKLGTKGSAAEKRAEAAKADAETTERSFTVLAVQTYYRTYYNHRALELNEQSGKLIEQSITSTKARYRTGADSHHEWILGKVEIGVLRAERLRMEREQKSLHALMNELRSKPPETPIELGKVEFKDDEKASPAAKESFENQPELKAARNQADAASSDETNARLSYLPDFVIQGMAMKPRMSGKDESGMEPKGNWGVMAGINVPIFFWRKQMEQVHAAKAEHDAAEADRRSFENRLRTEVVDANEQLKTAREVVALYKKDVIPLTEIAGKDARSGYAARRLPLTQLLDTLRVERTQNLELIAAQIDVELSKTRLENLLSSPPVLRLAPARPTVFGAGGMGSAGMSQGTSATVNMGSGMSGPTRKESAPSSQGGNSGMGNM